MSPFNPKFIKFGKTGSFGLGTVAYTLLSLVPYPHHPVLVASPPFPQKQTRVSYLRLFLGIGLKSAKGGKCVSSLSFHFVFVFFFFFLSVSEVVLFAFEEQIRREQEENFRLRRLYGDAVKVLVFVPSLLGLGSPQHCHFLAV